MEHLTIEEYEKIFMHGIESESIIKYFDDAVSVAIKPYFHMKKTDKSHFWFGDWENHCRKVISLYAPKGCFYFIRWGYNYDFIPHLNQQKKFVWYRTEKSVRLHVEDDYQSHIDCKELFKKFEQTKSYLDLSYSKGKYQLPIFASDVDAARNYLVTIVQRNIPFMVEWFQKVRTMDEVIEELDRQIPVTSSLTAWSRYWTKAFLLAKQNRMDESLSAINGYFDGREPDSQVIEKLYATSQIKD